MRDAVPAGELLLCAMQYHMEVHNKMKRVIACLLLVASLLAVCVIGASAQQGKNVIGEIGLYNGNITLDGVKDAAYTQYGTRFRADYWEGWGENKTGTIYGDFWFVFTDNYEKLHVYTEMHDDVIIAPSASKHSWSDGVCHTDCAEIWIDPTNNAGQYGKSDLRGAEAFHYRCDVSGFASGTMWGTKLLGNDACKPYFEAKVTTGKSYGYDIEWVIDTTAFAKAGITPAQGQQWGFQIQAKDVYSEKHRGEYWRKTDENGNPVSYNYDDDYYMCDFFFYDKNVTSSRDPSTAYLDMGELDNIVLAKSKSGGSGNSGTNTNTNNNGNTSNNGSNAPKTADTFVIAAAALIASAGAVAVVVKKRHH